MGHFIMGQSNQSVAARWIPTVEANSLTEHQVYVIDDDLQIRRSLHFLLSTAGFVSWSFASAADFLDSLPALKPAPILIDVRMPTIDGNELMALLLEQGINWPTIVMSAHGDIPAAVRSIKLGATEFLEKPFDFQDLEASLHNALAQLSSLSHAADIRNHSYRLIETLSAREREVILALTSGLPNKIIAHQLSLSVRTIEMHRANALLKLKVRSIPEVVRLARDAGIVVGDV